MAKTKISEFSSTPANNTDIDSINIAEGCAPSNINDAIRELMAQLKDFQTGAQGDSFNGPIGSSTAAAGAFTTLSATGAITSTLATGTAPLVIASTTKVANLNVDLLDGADWASPAALGSTTPAAVSATTLSASGAVTLSGGTANGVTYLNGSKVLTSGSVLKFDGTNLSIGQDPSARFSVSRGSNGPIASFTNGVDSDFYINGNSGVTLLTPTTPILAFGVSNAEQMRLTSTSLYTASGINVSLGATSSNGYRLKVADANVKTVAGAPLLLGTATGGSSDFELEIKRSASGSGAYYSIQSVEQNIDVRNLVLQPTGGNVGIGTSSPFAKLQVVAASADYFNPQLMIGEASNSTGKQLHVGYNTTANTGYIQAVHNGTGYKDLLMQPNGGNLGLGTAPSAWVGAKAISVGLAGSYYADGITYGWKTGLAANAYRTGNATWAYQNTGVRATRIESDETNPLAIYIAGTGTAGNAISFTQAATLTADGDFLVGTTTAFAKLSVIVPNGANRNLIQAGVTSATDGLTVKWNNATSTIRVNIQNLPTSSSGLASGDLWNDGGTLKIA